MKEDKHILNKPCKLEFTNGFILNGIVKDMNDFGVLFETSQKTSFVAWIKIKELTPIINHGGD